MSISVDEETLFKVRAALRKGYFRNKSHVFEYAVLKLVESTDIISNAVSNNTISNTLMEGVNRK
jgi:Arc/MetJ-type ribon-helix-helix transcriptional regulator